MGKVTIQSIARDLGLSRNTVSMALKGNELVTPRTRERILQYAQQVGFIQGRVPEEEIPEREAVLHQVMILRKPDVAVYWDKVINGISEEASRNHCQTQVAVVTQADEDGQRLPIGLNEGIEAVFCVKMMNQDYIGLIRKKGIRVFLLDDYMDSNAEQMGDIIMTESFQPMAVLTKHLLDRGMRRIGFLNESSRLYETMHDRFEGFLHGMRQGGAEIVPELVMPDADLENSEFYNQDNFERIAEKYQRQEPPEAVVCGNDEIAKYLTQAFRKKGVRVPEDVAVTGFDNDEEGMLDPFFTTVNVDAKWLGRRMVQCFLWRLEHPDAPYEKIEVSGQVIFRRSSCR